jgi:hypothetical protein
MVDFDGVTGRISNGRMVAGAEATTADTRVQDQRKRTTEEFIEGDRNQLL